MIHLVLPLLAVAVDVSDDVSPLMAALLLGWLVFLVCLVVVGGALLVVAVGILVGGLATGIFSASLLVWLKTKSATAGAKTFGLLLAGSAGAVGLWLLGRALHLPLVLGQALMLGGVGGAVAGVITEWLAWWAGRRVLMYANRILRLTP